MTITVKQYRALEINTHNAEPDDTLLVMTERGTPILLAYTSEPTSCLRRWRYDKESMFPIDTEQVEAVLADATSKASPTMQEAFAAATISVYTSLHLRLDQPLVCEVEATWPDVPSMQGIKHQLGTFKSGGGAVTSVNATTPARA